MISGVTATVVAKAIEGPITFESRAQEISRLPEFLEVILTSATGLTLVNVGDTEPAAPNRNKPWFKTSNANIGEAGAQVAPRGLYVWNVSTEAWENLNPFDSEELTKQLDEAKQVASDAQASAEAAEADADASKQYADAAQTQADTASTDAVAAEAAADAAQELYSGVIYGQAGPYLLDAAQSGPTEYKYSDPLVVNPPLDPAFPVAGFITLTGDSYPTIPFRWGVQVLPGDPTSIRAVYFNLFPTPVQRQVTFMYMVKGKPL